MQVIDRRIAFNGGEFSPFTDPRLDLEKYRTACKTLTNQRPSIYGGAFRRPGTIYMGPTADSTKKTLLKEFEFSVTSTLILEFSETTLRFWTTGASAAQIEDPGSPGNPYEVTTPWQEEDLYALQFAQQNDVVIITHPDYTPYILSRLANDDWTLEALEAEWPATLDLNITTTTLSLSNTAVGTGRTLTASAALFSSGHVGSKWVIRHRRTSVSVKLALNAIAGTNSTALFVLGEWSCNTATNTGGTWEANAIVQRSYDGSTWETIRSISTSGISSGTIAGTEIDPCYLRIQMESIASSPPANGSFTLEAADPDHYGLVTVTGYTSSTVVTVTVDFAAHATSATTRWEEGAWSAVRGYPRAVTFHESRLWFAGTDNRPQTIWGSIIDDYYNFRIGTDADYALSLTLAADNANGILWLVSQESLVIGTTGSEWVLGARGSDQALTPSTATAKRNTNYGSAAIQARAVHDSTLFIQRTGRKVREFSYSFEKDGFSAQDLTLLAEHITAGTILQISVQNNPETVLYCVTGEGDLIGLTYERGQNVSGWFRYNTSGDIESVAIVTGEGEDDEVWVSVKRTIDGVTERYIERFQTGHAAALKDLNYHELAFSDCAIIQTFSPAETVITGLDHLEGVEVTILADGSPVANQTVTAGEITLTEAAEIVVVGIPYTSTLEPTWLETNDPASMTKAMKKRVTRATVELYRTLGLEISGDDGTTWSQVEFRAPDDYMDQSPALFTGILEQSLEAGHARQSTVILRQTAPLPFNLMSLHVRYDVNEL